MTDSVNRITLWANGVIDSILATPEMWGSAEAVELQLLLMYETVVLAHRPAGPREVLDAYRKFLGERFGLTNAPANAHGMAYTVDVNRAFMKSELPKLIPGVRQQPTYIPSLGMKTFCATHHVSYELGFNCPRCTCCRCGSKKKPEQLNISGSCRDRAACEATSGKHVEGELETGV